MLLFSQNEFPVSDFKSLLTFLSEEKNLTFSYPAELERLKFRTTLVDKSLQVGDLQKLFQRINLECKVMDSHILIRSMNGSIQDTSSNAGLISIIISDSKTQEKISWAAVSAKLENQDRVYFSNEKGEVIIPQNCQDIKISQLGYESKEFKELKRNTQLELQPKPIVLNQVEKKSFQPAFKTKRGSEQIINYTQPYTNEIISVSGTKDVLGMVQMLPGITNADERSGSLKIRGSNADATNIFLNGIPVIQTGHYFDLFSTVNPLYVDKVTVYKSNTPVYDLSNSGGAVYLSSKTLAKKKTLVNSDINFLTANVNAYVPLTTDFAISGAFRQNIRDISNNSFYSLNKFNPPRLVENSTGPKLTEVLLRSSPTFGFYDGNLNAEFKYKYGEIHASMFVINDDYSNTITQNQRIMVRPFIFQNVVGKTINDRQWKSSGYGVTKSVNITSKLVSKLRWYDTGYDENYLLRTIVSAQTNLNRLTNETDFTTAISLRDLTWSNDYQLSKELSLTAGLSGLQVNSGSNYSSTRVNEYGEDRSVLNKSAFTQLGYISEKFSFQGGVKFNNVSGSTLLDWNTNFIKPLSPSTSIKFSAVRSNQLIRRINIRDIFDQSLGIWTHIGEQIPPLLAHQFTAGIQSRHNTFFIDVEGYLKKLDGVAELVSPQPQFNEPLQQLQELKLLVGKGFVSGVDLLVRYESDYFNTQIAYTLSKAINEIPGIFNGNAYPSINDRTHQFKMINTLKYKHWQISSNHIFATGVPFFTGRIDDDRRLNELLRNETLRRLPNYIRHDLGIGYSLDLGRLKSKIRLDIVNLLNRQNTNNIQYLSSIRDTRDPNSIVVTGTSTNMLNRTFNLGVYLEL
jgi:hypothetical protein